MTKQLQLTSPNKSISVVVDSASGGRLASLNLNGHELIVGRTADVLTWGSYPMVPFAGRVRNGLVTFAGISTQLPLTDGPHAMHGYGFVSPWTVVDDDDSGDSGSAEIRFDFANPWPWRGAATQCFNLTDDSLTLTLRIDAIDRQPVQLGWHPWFRRDIGNGHTAQLDFTPAVMYERDSSGLPSGRQVAPPNGPWDDCFGELASNPVLRWGDLRLELSSSATEWTVYNEPTHALCVEPQTGPPNQINDAPHILQAGESMIETFMLTWVV